MDRLVVRIFLYVLQFSLVLGYCWEFEKCEECTRQSWNGTRCRWCPLDKECHAHMSSLNTCKVDMNIENPDNCFEEGYGLYNPSEAFVNTLLSSAAYSHDPKQCIENIYPEGDFDIVEKIVRKCDDFLFDYEECFAYTGISHKLKVILLAYRGTTSTKQLTDEILTTLAIPKQKFVTGGKVQRYFKSAHDQLYSCTKNSISDLVRKYPYYDVTITGHSLGGALASLASARLVMENVVARNKMSLYTFGMPRVGNKEYAFEHDKLVNNSWRVVHYRDIVSHLPMCVACSIMNGPFHHRTEIYYGSKDMSVYSPYRQCQGNEDHECSNWEMTIHPCTYDVNTCITYHREYFGIEVGRYCDDKTGLTNRFRASAYVSSFPDDKCQRIPYKSHKSNPVYKDDKLGTIFEAIVGTVLVVSGICGICTICYKCEQCCKICSCDNC